MLRDLACRTPSCIARATALSIYDALGFLSNPYPGWFILSTVRASHQLPGEEDIHT